MAPGGARRGTCLKRSFYRSQTPRWVQQEKGVQSLKEFCGWRREIPGILPPGLFLLFQLTTSTVLQAGNGSQVLPLRTSSCHFIQVRRSPLHCQAITVRVGLAEPTFQWRSPWKGYTKVCSTLLLFAMGITWCWTCSASPYQGQLFHRSALPRCHISLSYCLCSTTAGFCIGALGHFGILRAKVLKHLNPKWCWKLRLSDWAPCVGRMASRPRRIQWDIFCLSM